MFKPFKDATPGVGFGYGWRISKKFDRQAIEHGGLINGFFTMIARFPSERLTVIVLSNNQNAPSERVADSLAAIVFGESYQLPKPPISDVLSATITKKGFASALL